MANAALAKADLCALRQVVARIEEGRASPAAFLETDRSAVNIPRLELGIEEFDCALDGGVPLAGMSEIRAELTVDAGAACGFTLALAVLAAANDQGPVLWVSEASAVREAGLPHAAGLSGFGLNPHNLVHAAPRKIEEALWIAETALCAGAFAAVILEVRGNPLKFGLTESRRLHLRARNAGVPLFLLRQAGEEEAGSALLRFRLSAAPARGRPLPDGSLLAGTIGNPVFHITVEKSRNPGPFGLFMEWNPNERQFYPAATGRSHVDGTDRPANSRHRLSASSNRPNRADPMGRLLAFDRAS
jgi:protein ImuA